MQGYTREFIMKRMVSRATAAPRAAFTMIELLVVIVVIAILVALLLPAVGGARYRARVAQVTTEIKNLEKGIADFKLKFGTTPPSRIVLCEEASDWNADWDSSPPVAGVDNDDRRNSIAVIRQIWPQYDFGDHDINGDSNADDAFLLTGPECLLFFLGGSGVIFDTSGSDTPIADGFSANPGNPFASGGNRVGPFHEFDPARMVDLDGDGAAEYLDPLPNQTTPIMYISSDEGRGYDPDDLDLTGLSSPTLTKIYFVDSGETEPHKPNSYQLISPGIDGFFGEGGVWESDNRLPVSRKEEWDNIANFSGGLLTP